MNTIRSVWFGWGALICAGGGAYYFAKRSINSDRAERAEADRRRRQAIRNLEQREFQPQKPSSTRRKGGVEAEGGELAVTSPSSEASQDPAPTRHAPETVGQRVGEKSKYEASEPWKSPKGDRFS